MDIQRAYRPLANDEIDAILDCKHDAMNLSIEMEIKSIQEMDRAFFLMLEMNQLNKEAA